MPRILIQKQEIKFIQATKIFSINIYTKQAIKKMVNLSLNVLIYWMRNM